MKQLFALAMAVPLVVIAPVSAAEDAAAPAGLQRTSSTGEGVRQDARAVKQGVKRTAREVKHGVKSGAREIGHGTRTAARQMKHAVKDTFR